MLTLLLVVSHILITLFCLRKYYHLYTIFRKDRTLGGGYLLISKITLPPYHIILQVAMLKFFGLLLKTTQCTYALIIDSTAEIQQFIDGLNALDIERLIKFHPTVFKNCLYTVKICLQSFLTVIRNACNRRYHDWSYRKTGYFHWCKLLQNIVLYFRRKFC